MRRLGAASGVNDSFLFFGPKRQSLTILDFYPLEWAIY
jgi:hypothetical protein